MFLLIVAVFMPCMLNMVWAYKSLVKKVILMGVPNCESSLREVYQSKRVSHSCQNDYFVAIFWRFTKKS